ncbi:hypothetical protein GIB67_032717 [Kingdonia uniflora]|uniref:RBR-type E3 ubiquitin transferase n=1 Tax=Kingdonia uniflora TaxID=39325 RepID=A0A7J7MWF4_9MAGN|nr:hypothetical protein GIB67_032717 [Kingdonia uniflora]
MDSEDDIHDATDLDSLDGGDFDDERNSGDDYDFEEELVEISSKIPQQQQHYTVLSEADIRQLQEDDTTEVSNVLSISKVFASILLRNCNWSVSKLHDDWFADQDRVRKSVGLLGLDRPVVDQFQNAREVVCGICFESYPLNQIKTAACGYHPFCNSCWPGYISTSITDGPGCLTLRCPDPSCDAAVDQDMINVLVSDEDKDRYSQYLLRSYVENNRTIKWCPAPGCEYAVNFVMGAGSYDVACNCTYSFCWNCTEETHRPVECETVQKWIQKNSAESENTNWILANSKPCPKCKRPIEKNSGCMHMTCSDPCRFQFCWLCLGSWKEHCSRPGQYYACNRYETAKQQGVYDEYERRRKMAKNLLERYSHYYERWAANEKSRQKAVNDLQQMKAENIEKLTVKFSMPESQLKFITEAWLQIIECRLVLKWTYAYGYYLPEHEQIKRVYFEFSQGEAEAGLERLHLCAEKELLEYLTSEQPTFAFHDFKRRLTGLTRVTRTFFENLVKALENGLADVDVYSVGCSRSASSSYGGGGKKKGGRTVYERFAEDYDYASDSEF